MKRVATLIILCLFLISFISGAGITASAIDSNNSNNQQNKNNQVTNQNNQQNTEMVKKIIQEKNRLRLQEQECPENCTCTDSVTKCQIENQREMTIRAGNSGNMIFQTKGINSSVKVELYKSENKIYGKVKGNQTKEIKYLPDQIQEKVKEKIRARLQNQTMKLDEEGIYQVQARKTARLFAIFPVKATIKAEVDSETGEIIKIQKPWWNFLAADENKEQ